MFFTDPLKSLTVATDATATTTEPSYSASFVDVTDAGKVQPGDKVGALTGATALAIVPATPGGIATRQLTGASIFNRDTVSHTITVNKVSGSTAYPVFKAVLGALEQMVFDGQKWTVLTAAGEVKTSLLGANTTNPGTKNGVTVTASESGSGVVHRTTLTCVATPISIADDAGVSQYGGVKVYDFPEGGIKVLGAVIDGDVTLGATGTIINTWAGGIALGSAVATTGATLTGTEADFMAEVDVAAAVAKVASVDAVSITDKAPLDGTVTAKDLYLNLVVDDDATHTAGTGTFTGTITFTWINLGDKS